MDKSTSLKCDWKNWGIGFGISFVASLGVRLLCWWLIFYRAPIELVTDAYCYDVRLMLLLLVLLLPICWALCYNAYVKRAVKHATDLHGVKIGAYGRPWVGFLLLLLVLLVLLSAACTLILKISHMLDFHLLTDVPLLRRTVLAFFVTTVVDLLLFILCSLCFRPAPVQDA